MKKFKFISIILVTLLIFSVVSFSVSASEYENVYVFDTDTIFTLYDTNFNYSAVSFGTNAEVNLQDPVYPDKYFGSRWHVFFNTIQTNNLSDCIVSITGQRLETFFNSLTSSDNRFFLNMTNAYSQTSAIHYLDIELGFNHFSSDFPIFSFEKYYHAVSGQTYYEFYVSDVKLPSDFRSSEVTSIDIRLKNNQVLNGLILQFAPLIVSSDDTVDNILKGFEGIFGNDYNVPNRAPIDDYNSLENQLIQGTDDSLIDFNNDMSIFIPNVLEEFRPVFLAVGNSLTYIVNRVPYLNVLLIISVTLGALGVLLGVFISFAGREDKGSNSGNSNNRKYKG